MASDVEAPKSKPASSSSGGSVDGGWKQRITISTILAGAAGGAFGLVLKRHRPLTAGYAANLAIVAGYYCAGSVACIWAAVATVSNILGWARELARDARASIPGDLINSMIGGITSGGLLGRLQGGQLRAIRYVIIFATVGTTVDYATLQLRPYLQSIQNTAQKMSSDPNWCCLPEWSPIQILDEEALAAKRAREQQLYGQRRFGTSE